MGQRITRLFVGQFTYKQSMEKSIHFLYENCENFMHTRVVKNYKERDKGIESKCF